jgi:hypothetical protein
MNIHTQVSIGVDFDAFFFGFVRGCWGGVMTEQLNFF